MNHQECHDPNYTYTEGTINTYILTSSHISLYENSKLIKLEAYHHFNWKLHKFECAFIPSSL